jgi:hypothetical protein
LRLRLALPLRSLLRRHRRTRLTRPRRHARRERERRSRIRHAGRDGRRRDGSGGKVRVCEGLVRVQPARGLELEEVLDEVDGWV